MDIAGSCKYHFGVIPTIPKYVRTTVASSNKNVERPLGLELIDI